MGSMVQKHNSHVQEAFTRVEVVLLSTEWQEPIQQLVVISVDYIMN